VTVGLFTFVDLYARALATADHLLTKGEERAAALGVGERDMLSWRLIDDMQPLDFQIMVVCNFTQLWPALVAGIDVPHQLINPVDVKGFRETIETANAFLAGLREEQFEGRDSVLLTHQIAPDMQLTMAVHVAYFWPDLGLALSEIARVLKLGGRLALVFRSAQDLAATESFPDSVYKFRSVREMRDALAHAGLIEVPIVEQAGAFRMGEDGASILTYEKAGL
jgi:uncharacterized protein